MSKSQNYYAFDNKSLPISVNIVAAYYSIVGPNYQNEFSSYQEKRNPQNSFSGFMHCVDGEGIIETLHGDLIIKKNSFCFLNHHDVKQFKNGEGKWTFFCIWFNYTSLTLKYNEVFNFELTQQEHADLFRMISLLHSENYIDHALANSICQLFICEFTKQIGEFSPSSATSMRMQKVATYIHENLHSDISISTLASMCGYCNNQFRTIFKQYFNLNPKEYVLKVKLEKAAFLLIHSNELVTTIAEELYFNSASHFISCFKQHFHVTPAEYREQNLFHL